MTSIVLAGGRSLRLGQDKASAIIGNKSLIQRVITIIAQLSTEIIVVTSQDQDIRYPARHPKVKTVVDLYPGRGSLGGIYSGIVAASFFHSLVVACDMPFLNLALLRYMINLSPAFDIVVPRVGDKMEPLHAVYSKNCLGPISVLLQQGKLKVTDLFDEVKVRYVEEAEMDRFDASRLSFFNINTPADLDRARILLQVKINLT